MAVTVIDSATIGSLTVEKLNTSVIRFRNAATAARFGARKDRERIFGALKSAAA